MSPKQFHDAALHVLARPSQYGLSEQDAYEIGQVANGYIGSCDPVAAYNGVKILQEIVRNAKMVRDRR